MQKTLFSMLLLAAAPAFAEAPFPIPGTMQTTCFDAIQAINCPASGEAFYGQLPSTSARSQVTRSMAMERSPTTSQA